MDAFRGCGGPVMSAESLLSEVTLQEVLKSAAVALPVLSPLQEPDASSDGDDVEAVADYAADDDMDDTPTSEVLLKVRTRTNPALLSAATSMDARNPPKYGGKDLQPDMLLRAHVAGWPTRLVTVSHVDLVWALEALPESSSRDVAAAVAEHFNLAPGQALAVRRRAAAMVAMEQHIVARVRHLLPSTLSNPDAVDDAVQRIHEYVSRFDARPVLPFE